MTTSMMRCLPRIRAVARQTPSIASSSTASSRCVSAHQARRSMHASPALDPSDQVAASSTSTTFEGLPTIEQASPSSVDGPQEDDVVHVKMAYLHPSTKDPSKAPRPQDIERGRIRAEPHYVPLSSHVFATKPRRDVLHSAVVYYLDGLRQGTGSTKSRGEVAFSGRKLLPQKGTGKARRGSRGSPLLRKGGVAHGPKPRDFSTKLNRRVRELALRSALSLRWQTGQLHVVKNFFWQAPPRSTRPLSLLLKTKGWDDALFLTAPRGPRPGLGMGRTAKPSAVDPVYDAEAIEQHSIDVRDFAIACANIPRTEIVKLNDLTNELQETKKKEQDRHRPGELHAYEVLARKTLICDLGAIEWLEEKLGGAMFLEESGGNVLDWAELAEEVDGDVGSTAPLSLAMDQLSVSGQGAAASETLSQEEKELNEAEDEAIELETDRVLRDVPVEGEGAKTK